MAKKYTVPADIREDTGKGASRRLRRTGNVPAILYGADRDPVNIQLEHEFVLHALEEEGFHSSVLELKVADGRTQKVILRDYNRHPFKPHIMHLDFQRISENEVLRLHVPLHFINEETSPAHKQAGVVISYNYTELEIQALPKDLPEYLEVDLAALEPGGAVMLSDIKLPEGVILPALEYGDEHDDEAVASAIYIRESQGEGVMAAEADEAFAEGEEEIPAEEAEAEAAEGEEAEGEEGEAAEEGEEASGESDEDKS